MLPEKNNFYAYFNGISKTDIRKAFINNNWGCGKASWVDFELTNNWSELILQGEEHEALLSGAVIYNNTNIETLDKLFTSLNAGVVYEFYDNEGGLILERKIEAQK